MYSNLTSRPSIVRVQLQPTGCMLAWQAGTAFQSLHRFNRHRFRMNCECSVCSLAPVFTYAPYGLRALRGTATAFPPVGGRNVAWAQPLSRGQLSIATVSGWMIRDQHDSAMHASPA